MGAINQAENNIVRTAAYNSTYPKVAVHWLNEVLYFYQSACLVDSKKLRNRHLRVAAKRYESTIQLRNQFEWNKGV